MAFTMSTGGAGTNVAPVLPMYYRTDDPVQNLKLRVTIRQIDSTRARDDRGDDVGALESKEREGERGRDKERGEDGRSRSRSPRDRDGDRDGAGARAGGTGAGAGAGGGSGAPKEWSRVFTWQQKAFGPGEILRYHAKAEQKRANPDKAIAKTRVESEYLETFQAMFASGAPVFESVEDVSLFTYTDKDRFLPEEDRTRAVLTTEGEPSTLAKAGVHVAGGQNKVTVNQAHLYRDAPFRTMYIMAAVDVDTERFRSHDQKAPFVEVPLVAVRAYKGSNLIEMKPGFSERVKMSARKRAKHGKPDLMTYRFTSKLGGVYEYTVENAADVSDELELDALREVERAAERRALEMHAGKITTAFFGDPPAHYSFRLHAFVEIVAAAGFDTDRLFVEYEVRLPKAGWKFPRVPAEGPDGRRVSLVRGDGSEHGRAGITQTTRVALKPWVWQSTERADDGAHAGTARASVDTGPKVPTPDGRGYGSGVAYVGAAPGSGGTAVTNRAGTRGAAMGGSGAGGDMWAGQGPSLLSGGLSGEAAMAVAPRRPVANLCFPVQFQALSHTDFLPSGAAEQPTIYFTVRSRDDWGREFVHGYGHYMLPAGASCSTALVSTWVPVGGIRHKLGDYFLGGAKALKDVTYTGVPADFPTKAMLSKFGFVTQASGDIALRVNTVVQRAAAPTGRSRKATTQADRLSRVMGRIDLGARGTLRSTLASATAGAGAAAGRPPRMPAGGGSTSFAVGAFGASAEGAGAAAGAGAPETPSRLSGRARLLERAASRGALRSAERGATGED